MLLIPEPDPFLTQMFARMSPGTKFTFTPVQIDEIKKAFSARSHHCHALDVRHSIRLFGKSYYLIVLAGRERRSVPHNNLIGRVLKLSRTIVLGATALACCLLFATFFQNTVRFSAREGIEQLRALGMAKTRAIFDSVYSLPANRAGLEKVLASATGARMAPALPG